MSISRPLIYRLLTLSLLITGCSNFLATTPNIVGLTKTEADSSIIGAGLVVGTVTREYNDTMPIGCVIRQDPMEGTTVSSDAEVSFVLSKGPLVVPNVVGLSQAMASASITDHDLALGMVTEQFNTNVLAGFVISQSPSAGVLVNPGISVSLIISKGPQPITVPSVIGTDQSAASAILLNAGLTVGSITQQYSSAVAKGLVIRQSPTANSSVIPGSSVILTISMGEQPIIMPNIVGQSQSASTTTITNLGLRIGTILEEFNARIPFGSVISQSPAPGTPVTLGTSVSITLSKGPQPITVPNVLNKSQSMAENIINNIGLEVGNIVNEYSNSIPAGTVISQSPTAGTSVPPKSAINLWVSNGPPPLQAAFQADFQYGKSPLTVQFRDMSTPGAFPIAAWHWIFGDGTESTIQNPSHVYINSGTYSVSLEVTSLAGSDTELKFNFIVVSPSAGEIQTLLLPDNVPLDMIWIPSGHFVMGSPETEQDGQVDEKPQHNVSLNGFWIGKYELTKRQWLSVMGTAPWTGQPEILTNLDSPAVYISWYMAQSFISTLNNLSEKSFRMPSESEWEYACRADTTTRFYWGNDPNYDLFVNYVWWYTNTLYIGEPYAHVVGQKIPNAWGLYDMNGNVWEWCQDWYHPSYEGAPADGSAWEIPQRTNRVLRGDCWKDGRRYCRSANRGVTEPSDIDSSIGLRLVMDAY